MNTLKKNILKKITAEGIDMKPRWHFVLKASLLFVGAIIAALVAVYLLSFIFFFLTRTGILFAPGYGFHGMVLFFVSSPWILSGLMIIFLLLLYVLVQRYSFSYRRPLLYSMLGVVFFVLIGSYTIQLTTMHERIGSFVERNNVPVFGSMYRGVERGRPEGMALGNIEELRENGFVLKTDKGETLEIKIGLLTKQPRNIKYSIGEEVMVFGEREADSIKAFGIRPVPNKLNDRVPKDNLESNAPPTLQNRPPLRVQPEANNLNNI